MGDFRHVLAVGEVAHNFDLSAVERVERISGQALIGESKLQSQVAREITFARRDGIVSP